MVLLSDSYPDSVLLPRCMECRRGLAMRILSVCLSVRRSVKRVHCDKTEEKSVHIFIPVSYTHLTLPTNREV